MKGMIIRMKIKLRLAAGIIAAAIIALGAGNICAFAEGETGNTSENSGASQTREPYLGSGAVSGGYYISDSQLTEDKKTDITVITYIPIENYSETLTEEQINALKDSLIFGIVTANDSFKSLDSDSWESRKYIRGSFLQVETLFRNCVYLGKGNTFSYSIYFSSGNTSVSAPFNIPIAECIETTEKPAEEPVSTPSFTLKPGSAYTVKAGAAKDISVQLNSVGSGRFSTIAASLSSPDSNVKVEDIGEKTSNSYSPVFNFRISVPKTAPEGVYNLTLNTTVYSVSGSPASSGSYTIPVTVESDVKTSGLTLDSYEVTKETVSSGDSFKLKIKLKNNCGIDLENVDVTLDGLDSSKFVLDGGFSKQSVSIKNGKTGTVTFPLVACAGINAVRESIAVTASYRIDPSKAETAQSFGTSVIITCAPKSENQEMGKYDLKMTDYSVSSDAVTENTKFTLSLTLKNTGKTDIKDARITVLNLDGLKFAVNSGLTYADFNIGAGKTKSFSFTLVGCAGISSIREVIPIQIDYGTVSSTVSATVSCIPSKSSNPEVGQVFAPNIIIESYDFGGEFVTAGQKFPLNVVVKNTSSEASIENLKVTVNGGSSSTDGSIAYSPANSSNSFFFEKLGMKATAEINLDLLAKADAAPNSYPILITFTYEYSVNGKRQQANGVTETITIPLQQEDRLTINQIEAPNYAVNVGQMCNINTSLVNKGKSGVYNVTAKVEGEGFEVSTGSYYIGNVASGSEEYYDAQITPMIDGEIKGEVVITYEDANGAAKEQRMPFSFTAMSFNYDDMMIDGGIYDPSIEPGYMPEGEGGSDMTWLWFVIGGGAAVVIAAVIIIIVVVKKKKRKKELEDEDEDI